MSNASGSAGARVRGTWRVWWVSGMVAMCSPIMMAGSAWADVIWGGQPLSKEEIAQRDWLFGLTTWDVFITTGLALLAIEISFLGGLVLTRRRTLEIDTLPEPRSGARAWDFLATVGKVFLITALVLAVPVTLYILGGMLDSYIVRYVK